MTTPYRLEGLELAAGLVPGHVPVEDVEWPVQHPDSVREALRSAVRPHLLKAPCAVAFSGGRDSSVVLAVATEVARLEGLALPVPVSRLHPGVEDLDEADWQRRVIDHLQLREWVQLSFTDEMDLVGPVAQRVLRRHGVVWPAAAHTSLPILDVARGGVVLTGEGGDELFGPFRVRMIRAALAGRPSRRRLRAAGAGLAPRSVRRRRAVEDVARHLPPWLTVAARAELAMLLAEDEATEPLGLRAATQRLLTRRSWRRGRETLDAIAADAGSELVHPLLDPSTLAALQRTCRPWGFPDRTTALTALFADLLPVEVLARRTKAVFNRALFHRHSREVVERWSGSGVDITLVDPERLRDEWRQDVPSVLSAPLLQAVAGRRRV